MNYIVQNSIELIKELQIHNAQAYCAVGPGPPLLKWFNFIPGRNNQSHTQ